MMDYSQDFRVFLQENQDISSTMPDGYSGSSRKQYGIRAPVMRDFIKQWTGEHRDLNYDDWQATLDGLYQGESMEERAFAGLLIGHYSKFRQQMPLSLLDSWLDHLEGWVEVDTTCQSNFTAKEMLTRWSEWQPFLVDLSQRETLQHRRASLVLFIKALRESDDKRLIDTALDNVERLKHEKDRLITKAVSWVLRSAIKQHRARVGQYVENNLDSLPAIAVREFKKKYETGVK